MPIDQYRKDKRVVRGIQRGASSFSSSTAMAMLDLTNRFVYLIQNTAQFAHDVVTPPSHHNRYALTAPPSRSQPRDLREGMTTAYAVVREGLHDTVRGTSSAFIQADNYSGAFGGVLRQVPSAILGPLINISQATQNVLMGARNAIDPEARKHDQDKWKNHTER